MRQVIAVAVVLCLSSGLSQADVIVSVDFDVGGGPTQAGYESFAIGVHTGPFSSTKTVDDAFALGEDLTVRIHNLTGAARTRNRNPVTGVFASISSR